jgi:hypothetical protein
MNIKVARDAKEKDSKAAAKAKGKKNAMAAIRRLKGIKKADKKPDGSFAALRKELGKKKK